MDITKGPVRWWGPMKITKQDREETSSEEPKVEPEPEPEPKPKTNVEIKIPDSSSNLPI